MSLDLIDLVRTYRAGGSGAEVPVLKGANLTLRPGELVALIAPSGAGKSTLLHLAGLLERPDSGMVRLDGVDAGLLDDDSRTQLRRDRIGFVYQFHHLLPEFSALENVALPQMIVGVPRRAAELRARGLLEQVGLGHRLSHRPATLSGGEQQRVAIVRALANTPKVLLADEPTGNLDPKTAEGVFDMLRDLTQAGGTAALLVTHNPDLARRLDRIVRLEGGVIVGG